MDEDDYIAQVNVMYQIMGKSGDSGDSGFKAHDQ